MLQFFNRMKQIIFLSIILLLLSCFNNNEEVLAFESTNISFTPRIINGEDADIIDFPYQAQLRVAYTYFCAASTIGLADILAVAHCFTHTNDVIWPFFDVSIHMGTSSSQEIGDMYRIDKITIHPGFTGLATMIHDIAHIKLDRNIEFDETKQMLSLPPRNVPSNKKAWLTAWGYTSLRYSQASEQLQKLRVRTLKYRECQEFLPRHLIITKDQVCGYQGSGQGCYKGDSGAPVVIDNVVYAIQSWYVMEHCASGRPDIYTNVYTQLDFLLPLLYPA